MQNYSECLNAIGHAVSVLGTEDFLPTLCEGFANTTDLGHLLVLHFPKQARPRCAYTNSRTPQEYDLEVEAYINGPYIFDPYYQASLNGAQNGAYRLKDIAPDNFKKTEFFRHYYKATNINDELSYLVALPNDEHLHLSLSCVKKRKNMPASLINFLVSISPIITELMAKHWVLIQQNNGQPAAAEPASSLNQTLQQALKSFGSMLLTPREHDVLQLILHGHSNKAAAHRLDISLATVKLHRKRIYQKLDISSQSELFYLFIDALSSAENAGSEDPLQAYMNL